MRGGVQRGDLANARASVKEPGVARFDIVQQQDDPARFVFVEVYRDAAAAAAHKETHIIRSGVTRSRR